MFGISFPEFLIVAILLVSVTNPKDIPKIAQYLTKLFYKAKNIVAQAREEVNKAGKELGLEKIKREAQIAIKKEQDELQKTTIIDIYGNEHEVHDVKKIRGDLAKEDLQAEIEKHNKINKKVSVKKKRIIAKKVKK